MRIAILARPVEDCSATPLWALRGLARALTTAGARATVDHAVVPAELVGDEISRLAADLGRRWSFRPPDVVHAHGTVAALAALAAARDRIPVVVTFDEDPGHTDLEAELALRARAAIARCTADREGLRLGRVPTERVHLVPLPVETLPTTASERSDVATCARGESLERVVRSMPWWPEGARLVVAAALRPRERDRVLRVARGIGVAGRVVVNPLLRDAGRSLWARAAVVVAGPEGARHGAFVLEGAAHAVPAIAVDRGAHREAVVDGATGVLLPEDAGAADLGRAVAGLLSDPLRLTGYGLAAQLRVRESHDPAYLADRTLAIYRAVSAGPAAVADERAEDEPPLDEEARRELVVENLPVARRIAQRYAGRGQALGDLIQVASLGLVKAARRFDPEQGADFLSYAVPTMLGELRRYFRDNAWAVHVPRGLQETVLRVQQADDALRQDLGHSASAGEIAGDLGIGVADVLEAQAAGGAAFRARSLEAPIGDGSGEGLADLLGGEDVALESVEDREALHAALARIPGRERQILVMRFFGEQTQSEIAAKLGISQMHVSRLLAKTLRVLREHVVDGVPLPASWQEPAFAG